MSQTIIIGGIQENIDAASVWRDTVGRVLRVSAGRGAHIEDAFRLGKFIQGRKRPILVEYLRLSFLIWTVLILISYTMQFEVLIIRIFYYRSPIWRVCYFMACY